MPKRPPTGQSPGLIFLFSLPRAGSTLLQRILGAHPDIATAPEPWLLLPLLHMDRDESTLATYSHSFAAGAIRDFVGAMPGGRRCYEGHLGHFVRALYATRCPNNERYFLDKTPRYYLVAEDIARVFPDAKLIFLFRDPLQVIASIIETWGDGRLYRLHDYLVDIRTGIPRLADAYSRLEDRAIRIDFDDLLDHPEGTIQRLTRYLGLRYEPSLTRDLHKKQVPGRLGDQSSARRHMGFAADTKDKWRMTLASRLRRRWVEAMLEGVTDRQRRVHGLDASALAVSPAPAGAQLRRNLLDALDIAYLYCAMHTHGNIFLGRRRHYWRAQFLN